MKAIHEQRNPWFVCEFSEKNNWELSWKISKKNTKRKFENGQSTVINGQCKT